MWESSGCPRPHPTHPAPSRAPLQFILHNLDTMNLLKCESDHVGSLLKILFTYFRIKYKVLCKPQKAHYGLFFPVLPLTVLLILIPCWPTCSTHSSPGNLFNVPLLPCNSLSEPAFPYLANIYLTFKVNSEIPFIRMPFIVDCHGSSLRSSVCSWGVYSLWTCFWHSSISLFFMCSLCLPVCLQEIQFLRQGLWLSHLFNSGIWSIE